MHAGKPIVMATRGSSVSRQRSSARSYEDLNRMSQRTEVVLNTVPARELTVGTYGMTLVIRAPELKPPLRVGT